MFNAWCDIIDVCLSEAENSVFIDNAYYCNFITEMVV